MKSKSKRDSVTKTLHPSDTKILTKPSISTSATDLKKDSNKTSLTQFQKFEHLRNELLQWHFLNAEIKERMKSQAENQEVLF